MKKKKICVLNAQVPFVRGGAEMMVQNLVNELLKRNYDAELVQIPFKWYPENTLYDNMLMWRLLDLQESNGQKIDMVIGTKFPSYGVQHDNKILWLMHQFRQVYDLYSTENGLQQAENGNEIKMKVINYDNLVINECKQKYSISKNVSHRLKQFNNIDSLPLYQPPSLIGQYYCEDYNNYILSVGRLDLLKRNDLLIRALVHCDKSVIVKIAGRGLELDNLKKLAKQLGVSDRVEFLGFVADNDLLKLYANALAVYFAPIDEDYGFITLEAFLSKKPIITCKDSGGVLEFVSKDSNGYICDVAPEAVGDAIEQVRNNKNRSKEFGNNGYQIVKDITWDNVIDRLTQTIR